MSGEALYERYKEALKRGHVASLRGRLDEALTAYAEAAAIAPERATPHTSAGTALLRRRRPDEALGAFDRALRLAPRDEAALLGRAQALVALDRRRDAADGYDTLAEAQAAGGKLGEAVDAARRGLELAEGRDRRRMLERLIERLRESEPSQPGRLALERALLVLEGQAVALGTRAPEVVDEDATSGQAGAVPADRGPAPETTVAAPGPWVAAGEPAALEPEVRAGEPAGVEPDADVAAVAAGEPAAPPIRAALDRDLPTPVDLEAMTREAERALEQGDPSAIERCLDLAAAAYRCERPDLAMDACYQALSADPDNVGIHLALVRLYDSRGWGALAVEKLELLGRLAELDEDEDATMRLELARSARA